MIFRYARHTKSINDLANFYTEGLGLENLGEFKNHSSYNRVFIGTPNTDWLLEFTESFSEPSHRPDPDDLTVYYVHSKAHMEAIQNDMLKMGFEPKESLNPYWKVQGIEYRDSDGFGVMLSLQEKRIDSLGNCSTLLQSKGIETWDEALNYTQRLPYGRNSSRRIFTKVIKEGQGTCSSKHAFLAQLATENKIADVQLMMCIYKMNASNTPGIGEVLLRHDLDYLPEAHCYLQICNKRIDLTSEKSDIEVIAKDIIEEQHISAEQVVEYKVNYHHNFIKNWIKSEKLLLSFDELWSAREECITAISNYKQH